jgi:hypothetical protein
MHSRTIWQLGHSGTQTRRHTSDSPVGFGGNAFLPLFVVAATFRTSRVKIDGPAGSSTPEFTVASTRRTRLLRVRCVEGDIAATKRGKAITTSTDGHERSV